MKLQITKITNKRAYGYCPFHEDTSPSFEIKLEGEHFGEYYCYGCGKTGSLSTAVLSQILERKKNNKQVDQRVTTIDWDSLNGKYGLEYFFGDYQVPFNVSKSVLQFLNCGWDGQGHTFPMRNGKGEVIGIQRRFPNGLKSMVEGSRLGLFIPYGVDYSWHDTFICEGVSDTATLLDMGYVAIGRPNNSYGNDMVLEWITEHNTFQNIWIMADNDDPGIKGANELAKDLEIDESNILIPMEKDIRKHREYIGTTGTINWINERINK